MSSEQQSEKTAEEHFKDGLALASWVTTAKLLNLIKKPLISTRIIFLLILTLAFATVSFA
ncbi:MAG: hypothetical protein Ct9H300mP23_02700 [Nitrospinota bacterium]|nr:MAG: hypothetical protein Ct9H300mP23_02700 [Nitrospinota bacterium]